MKKTVVKILTMMVLLVPFALLAPGCRNQNIADYDPPSRTPEPDVTHISVGRGIPAQIAQCTDPTNEFCYVGWHINVHFSDDTTEERAHTEFTVSAFDMSVVGPHDITITYNELNLTHRINVLPYVASITEITFHAGETQFVQNTSRDTILSAWYFQLTFTDRTEVVPSKHPGLTISDFSTAALGDVDVTVTYDGQSTSVTITIYEFVDPYQIIGIEAVAETFPATLRMGLSFEAIQILYASDWAVRVIFRGPNVDPVLRTPAVTPFSTDALGIVNVQLAYRGHTTYIPIEIVAPPDRYLVESIAFRAGTTTFTAGTAIDLGDWSIYVTFANRPPLAADRTEVRAFPDFSVSVIDLDILGPRSITISYGGVTTTISITVVRNPMEIIDITATGVMEFTTECTDITEQIGQWILTIHRYDPTRNANIIASYATIDIDINTGATGIFTIYITFEGFIASFSISVLAPPPPVATGIELVIDGKTFTDGDIIGIFDIGTKISTSGWAIRIHFDRGESQMANSDFVVNGLTTATLAPGYGVLKIRHLGHTITVLVAVRTITEIALVGYDTEFIIGDTINTANWKLHVTFDRAPITETISFADFNAHGVAVSALPSTIGIHTIIVTFGGRTYSFTITISPPPIDYDEVQSITWHNTPPMVHQNTAVDTSAWLLSVTFPNRVETIPFPTMVIDTTTLGPQGVIVAHLGFTATLTLVVVRNPMEIVDITVTGEKSFIIGDLGFVHAIDAWVITIHRYDSSLTAPTKSAVVNVNDLDINTLGIFIVTIMYGGFTITTNVTVNPNLDVVTTIDWYGTAPTIHQHATANTSNWLIAVTFSNRVEAIPFATTSTINTSTLGPQTVTVSHLGFTTTLTITIIRNPMEIIDITVTGELTFVVGDMNFIHAIDAWVITIHRYDSSLTAATTSAMVNVNDLDINTVGSFTVTISYGGFITSVTVTINPNLDQVTSITWYGHPPTIHQNTNVDTSGWLLLVAFPDRTETIPFPATDIDTTTLGSRAIAVSYRGFTTTVTITIVRNPMEITRITVTGQKSFVAGDADFMNVINAWIITIHRYDTTLTATTDAATINTNAVDINTAGTFTAIVFYNGISINVTITVTPLQSTDPKYTLEIFTLPPSLGIIGSINAFTINPTIIIVDANGTPVNHDNLPIAYRVRVNGGDWMDDGSIYFTFDPATGDIIFNCAANGLDFVLALYLWGERTETTFRVESMFNLFTTEIRYFIEHDIVLHGDFDLADIMSLISPGNTINIITNGHTITHEYVTHFDMGQIAYFTTAMAYYMESYSWAGDWLMEILESFAADPAHRLYPVHNYLEHFMPNQMGQSPAMKNVHPSADIFIIGTLAFVA
ncbi:MAG: hypothetical protein FWE38_05320 [Firmicutes bacterium]|nr:hypothetical protein [Bacillota bacterium]